LMREAGGRYCGKAQKGQFCVEPVLELI
jgi:hypothetical protein